MDQSKTLFSTNEAAEYLSLSVPSVKYHTHVSHRLQPQRIGNSLVFTRDELDRFLATDRPGPGRPRKSV